MTIALRGQTISFSGDPFIAPPEDCLRHETDGVVVIENGLIAEIGPAEAVLPRWPDATVTRYVDKLILPGFIDCHIHYPQFGVIASYGAQLLEWLNKYTFPEELRFEDPAYARTIADRFLDELARNGTTSASAYATVHPQSANALFEAAEARGVRIATGKVMMDRHAPDELTDTAQSGYDDSKALLERWDGVGRAKYVVTPRFSPTSTPGQLEAAGALWSEHPDALMQTHISENPKEIAWVRELFPEARDYLDTYERAGLIGPGSNFGHAIHLTERERDRLRDSGSGISHCPTSNTFIGSGLFDLHGLRGEMGVAVGIATDVGGGSSFSMLASMRCAYEIAQLRGRSLHPVCAYYLATLGSAHVLRMADKVGNLAAGYEADIVILDPKATPLLADRTARCETIYELLFALMVLGDDRAVRQTYAAGRPLL